MSTAITPARSALDEIGPRRPPQSPRSDAARVWAGFVLVVLGVVLIGLGGGALVGVLELLRMRRQASHEAALADVVMLQNVLYVVAAACFATAAVVLFLAIRGLCRIMRQRTHAEDLS